MAVVTWHPGQTTNGWSCMHENVSKCGWAHVNAHRWRQWERVQGWGWWVQLVCSNDVVCQCCTLHFLVGGWYCVCRLPDGLTAWWGLKRCQNSRNHVIRCRGQRDDGGCCFVNSRFILKNNLLTYSVPPIQLCLFNGNSNNVITQAIEVPLRISPEHVTPFTFYLTLLNSSCAAVLGYNWPTPTICWLTGFRAVLLSPPSV